MTAVLRRLARLVWIEVSEVHNPWFNTAVSSPMDNRVRWEDWNRRQFELTRELYVVVFDGAEPTEDLLTRALDFLDGQ